MGNNNKKTNPDLTFMTALQEMSNNNTAKTFDFNAKEAEKARIWQTYMSNTSHQREVQDLIAAGLNPVMSANGGAASYSASNASGSADASAVNALANLYMTRMNNNTSLQLGKLNAKVGLASAAATKFAASASAAATMAASANSAAAQRYSADKNYDATLINSKINNPIGSTVQDVKESIEEKGVLGAIKDGIKGFLFGKD